ncbi:hypothetical protein NS365_13310 [Aureimonas ureilytica]|uniref:Uncharacterized protein n=2 Tax=Aureimonas ureilytica TaxID=401562 RepID=A0A175RQN0_9HYPH|nr:hypothetical protein NS365_13310 [Aureimonas ureilytica]
MNASRKRGGGARVATLPAPIGGWNTSENLTMASPGTALVMDNWRPTQTGATLRGGSITRATISLAGDPVTSLMSYNGSTARRLFAASKTAIFDVSTPADPVVPPAAAVSGQTKGYYAFQNFTTSGGAFLTAVNGADPLLLFEPSQGWKKITGTSTPAITGVSTSLLSHVWVYRNREFFIQADSLRAWYLPVNSIAGEAKLIDMNGVFQRGGALLFGATWSVDTGDGLDDKCVFVTTEGEVAVYTGADPSSASSWSLQGRYEVTRPLGPRGIMYAGGDLVIATEDGMIPLSEAVNKDPSVLNFAAISKPIFRDWQDAARDRRTLPWEVVKWPEKGYAIVSTPIAAPGQEPSAFVVNTVTGAWCRYTNWDVRCLLLHAGRLYFGTGDGRIKEAEIGGNDDGAAIYYTLIGNPDHLGSRGVLKSVRQARATYRSSTPFIDRVSASMDYQTALPAPPPTATNVTANEWDAGKWDEAKWDAPEPPASIMQAWVSIGLSGTVMQYQVQITGALTAIPDTELLSIDVSYEPGGVIV